MLKQSAAGPLMPQIYRQNWHRFLRTDPFSNGVASCINPIIKSSDEVATRQLGLGLRAGTELLLMMMLLLLLLLLSRSHGKNVVVGNAVRNDGQ